MPTLISGPVQAVNDLADQLAQQIQSGQAARATLGAKDAAFAWTTGAPPVVASMVNRVAVDSLSFNAVLVGMTGTPPAEVAEGGTKPVAIQLTAQTVPLKKYAGLGSFSTEDWLTTDALAAAVYGTLISGALLAYDKAVVNAIEANAGLTPAASTGWSGAILSGVAAVAGNGGRADLLLMNPADYAGAVVPEGGFTTDPASSIPVLFGLKIALSAEVTAGTALVFSSAAVTCAENSGSPVVVVDPYSGLSTNAVRIAAELFAGVVVNAPANVAKVTKS